MIGIQNGHQNPRWLPFFCWGGITPPNFFLWNQYWKFWCFITQNGPHNSFARLGHTGITFQVMRRGRGQRGGQHWHPPESESPGSDPGRLRDFVNEWSRITKDRWALNTLSWGYRLEFTSDPPPPQSQPHQNHTGPVGPTQGNRPKGGGGGPPKEGRHYATGTGGTPAVLSTLLPHAKEKRPVETYPEPQATKPVHEATEVQDWDSVQNPNQTFSGPLGVLNRSSGCVPPRACGEGTQPVHLLPVRRGILPVIGTSLRAVNSTQDLHETGQDYGIPPQANGDPDIRLPRRLASGGPVRSGTEGGHEEGTGNNNIIGLDCELRQIQPVRRSEGYIPRSGDRFPARTGLSDLPGGSKQSSQASGT